MFNRKTAVAIIAAGIVMLPATAPSAEKDYTTNTALMVDSEKELLGGWSNSFTVSLSLYEDGSFSMQIQRIGAMTGIWRVEAGNLLILTHKRGLRPGTRDRLRFRIVGGRLVTKDEDTGDSVTYNRVGR